MLNVIYKTLKQFCFVSFVFNLLWELANLFCKGPDSILSFVVHMVSLLLPISGSEHKSSHKDYLNKCGHVPIKPNLHKQMV